MVQCQAINQSRNQRCTYRAVGIDSRHEVVWLCGRHIRATNYTVASHEVDMDIDMSDSDTEELQMDIHVDDVFHECSNTTVGYVSDDYRTCVICQDMNVLTVTEMVAVQTCGHTYHTECIKGWVTQAVRKELKKPIPFRKNSLEVPCPCCRMTCQSYLTIGKEGTGFYVSDIHKKDECQVFVYFTEPV
jgi:hypothetical protein